MNNEKSNKIGNIKSFSEENFLAIKSENSPFAENFYFCDFFEEGKIKKFIKNTEKLIRQSREYNDYISLLRTNITSLNRDNILSNIRIDDASLEFHHYPFSLFDIVETIMMTHLIKDEKISSFLIGKEVLDLHYKNLIGVIPLSVTMHELAHSGNIFISSKQIFGNYKKFISLYEKGISNNLKNKLKLMEENEKNNIKSDFKGVLDE